MTRTRKPRLNRETRAVYSHLTPWYDDYWVRAAVHELRVAETNPALTRRDMAHSPLYFRLSQEVREAAPRNENRMYDELLNTSFARVDWGAIASLLLDRAIEEERLSETGDPRA